MCFRTGLYESWIFHLIVLYDYRIGKSSGYKATELLALKEDETLCIGGKEIQVWKLFLKIQKRIHNHFQ